MNEKPTRSQVRFQTMHEGKAISCEVSDRYIALKADADAVVAFGTPVWLDVMTNKYGSAADRKICQLCFPRRVREGCNTPSARSWDNRRPQERYRSLKLVKKCRIAGVVAGATTGAAIGAGTGIVGGPFGAVAGVTIFTLIGAGWGLSAGPDAAQKIEEWRNKKPKSKVRVNE